MRKEKFTKGPWFYEKSTGEIYSDNYAEIICDMLPTGDEEFDANAALIEAVPDMHEMLKTACSMFGGTEFASRAESLLAKVRGE